jgi:hypothetical protein
MPAHSERQVRSREGLDDIQNQLIPMLKERGYTVRGRTFNRLTADGLIHEVKFQIGGRLTRQGRPISAAERLQKYFAPKKLHRRSRFEEYI